MNISPGAPVSPINERRVLGDAVMSRLWFPITHDGHDSSELSGDVTKAKQ